jgi:hypothetical protein
MASAAVRQQVESASGFPLALPLDAGQIYVPAEDRDGNQLFDQLSNPLVRIADPVLNSEQQLVYTPITSPMADPRIYARGPSDAAPAPPVGDDAQRQSDAEMALARNAVAKPPPLARSHTGGERPAINDGGDGKGEHARSADGKGKGCGALARVENPQDRTPFAGALRGARVLPDDPAAPALNQHSTWA